MKYTTLNILKIFTFFLILLSMSTGCTKYTPPVAPSNVDFTLNLNDQANSALKANGNSLATNNILIIRDPQGNFFANQLSCTYMQCNLTYSSSDNLIQCPCHNCFFYTNGTVISGKATVSLKSYYITLTGTMLRVHS